MSTSILEKYLCGYRQNYRKDNVLRAWCLCERVWITHYEII